jgi:diguanylate cyclase (GGDEF)-like protein
MGDGSVSPEGEGGLLAFLITDRRTRVSVWPSSAERLFGKSSADALGATLQQLAALRDEDARAILRDVADLGEGRSELCARVAPTFDAKGRKRSCKWVSFRLDPGDADVVVSLVEDVTSELEARDKVASRERTSLRRAEAAREAFAKQVESYRRLYRAVAAGLDALDQQVQASLQLGCQTLLFECAYVAAYGEDRMTVKHAIDCQELPMVGTSLPRPLQVDGVVSAPSGRGGTCAVAEIAVFGEPFGLVAFESRKRDAEPFTDVDRDFARLTALFIGSVLERREQQQHLDRMAYHDALTGLPNRVLLRDRLTQAILAAERERGLLAVLFIDLDDFKRVNDSFGHAAGDQLLIGVGARLRSTLRKSDSIARLGGDEFIIIQRAIRERSDAVAFARKVIETLQEPFELDVGPQRVSASIGIAIYPDDGQDYDTLVRRADEALFRAKDAGHGVAVFYDPAARSGA